MKNNVFNNEYAAWKKSNFDNRQGFFPVFSDFKMVMRHLSPGATTLYVYLGLYSNYKTGEVYHSLGTISNYFDKSTRTISNWMKELEQNKLIYRSQKEVNGVSHTYLLPYGEDHSIKNEQRSDVESLINQYLYFKLKYDPSEYDEDYDSNHNKKVREIIGNQFPKATINDIKRGWNLFYNMPPQE